MADTVTMPKLGFDMQEGTLVRWVRHEGEMVEKGQVLAEIETDKATVEVESQFSGTILKHLVEQGSIVPVGTAITVIGAAGENVDAAAGADGAAKAEVPQKETKTAKETKTGEVAPTAVEQEEKPTLDRGSQEEDRRVKASPVARKMAAVHGVDLAEIDGSGPGGRIIKRDVEAFEANAAMAVGAAPDKAKAAVIPPPAMPAADPAPGDEVVPMERLRQAIGRRMVESKTSVPHFYVTHNYNVEALLALRKTLNEYLPDEQKLTVNDLVVRAAGLALREFPNLNASLQGNTIVRKGNVHIGVAVAVPGGLLTVVVKDADRKPLRQISQEVKEMAVRARAGKVKPDDIEGSSFSISNLGMFDVEHFIAIINPPESAILAVGSAQKVPVVVNDQLAVGTRMKMTISADHRVSDGAEAAQFMQALAKYIEEPMRLLV
jgi:pyruvate dehydrogenase E2 component (dihydrolipoamide acetyltransferase)